VGEKSSKMKQEAITFADARRVKKGTQLSTGETLLLYSIVDQAEFSKEPGHVTFTLRCPTPLIFEFWFFHELQYDKTDDNDERMMKTMMIMTVQNNQHGK
jgi:hypothetical protein